MQNFMFESSFSSFRKKIKSILSVVKNLFESNPVDGKKIFNILR